MAIDTDTSMRFMANNLLEAGVASFSVSSEDSGHPKSNMLDPLHRTKTFKFSGRFTIDATNNKIYVNGNTYTLTNGEYTTPAALAAHIQTIISAESVNVEWQLTGDMKFVFSKGSTFTMNVSSTTNAIWETIGFTGAVDVVATNDGGTYYAEPEEVRIHWPYEEITVDFGYQATVGFVAMIGDLSREVKIPEGATITVLGNTVNSFAAPPLSQTIPWYSTGVMKFIDDIADSSWRYMKIRIECPTNSYMPEIGYLYMGEYEKFPDMNIGTGFELTHEDASELSEADSGAIYHNAKTPARVFSNLYVGLARPEQASLLKRLYSLKQLGTPFFVALDPTEYLSDTFDEHLAFVRFSNPPRYRHILRDIYELSFELREAL